MTTKMLINTQRAGHLRVAIVRDTQLEDYQVEIAEAGLTRGNIYRGVIANVQPSLNAAFVDIGEDRHAFLPVGDVLSATYHRAPPEDERRPRIDQVLEKGKPIYVQVTKDGVGQKGAALTTNIALAGRYLVLAPFDSMRGISRKAEDDAERKKARQRLAKLNLPDGFGVIVRTNGIDQNLTTLNRDINALTRLWRQIRGEGSRGRGPRLLYSDQDLVVQALRDYLDSTIEQVIVDSQEVYQKAESYMQAFMPRSKKKLIRYEDRQPLFSRYSIETLIEGIYDRRAQLPGGGSIVIDATEALTAIDVNSGRATQTANHDEAIFNVNVEAAEEVGRQLRLRDIGGLVVVDFIDMRLSKHQRKLEKAMRDALKADRARTSVGRISPNGLLEINRQRIKQSLRHRTHRPCPTCQGAATIPSSEFAALNVLGRIEARASTGLMKSAMVILHPEIADALQNHHRRELSDLEQEFELEIEIISNPSLTQTQERIDWTQRESPLSPAAKAAARAQPALTATDISQQQPRRRKAAATESEAARGDDGAAEERPKRKRRRRKRSEPADADRPAAVAEEAQAAPSEGEEAPKPRRRRRPTRRRRKPADDAAPPSVDMAADARMTLGDRPAAESEASADGEEAPKPRRRRPPRRRKPADGNGPREATAADGGREAGPESGDEAAPSRSRRAPRRRRPSERRAPREAAAPEPGSGPESGDEAPPSRSRRPPRRRGPAARAESQDTAPAEPRRAIGRDSSREEAPERPRGRRRGPTRQHRPSDSEAPPAERPSARGTEVAPPPAAARSTPSKTPPVGATSRQNEKLSSPRPLARWMWWRRSPDSDD